MAEKKIQTALISVFHKDGLEQIIAKLHADGVRLLSTGGTQKFIEQLGYPCDTVESLTTYPSILGGRVKTLHPKVFGGISLIRAGAKNFNDVAIVASKAEYPILQEILDRRGACTSLEERRLLAERAFAVTSHYDTAIHAWFASKK